MEMPKGNLIRTKMQRLPALHNSLAQTRPSPNNSRKSLTSSLVSNFGLPPRYCDDLIKVGQMSQGNRTPQLLSFHLLGPFAVFDADGKDITPKSQKACALLAMLSLSPRQTRTRVWLKDKLWSDRAPAQAANSLRQCLHHLRQLQKPDAAPFMEIDASVIRLVPGTIQLDLTDVFDPSTPSAPAAQTLLQEQLLEGLDIPDPEFEDWLSLERQVWETKVTDFVANQISPPSDGDVVPDAAPDQVPNALLGPSVSVQAFRIEGDADMHPYFAEGLVDDLIVSLSKNAWLKVISKNAPRGNAVLVASATDGPGPHMARYTIDGALRFFGEEIGVQVILRKNDTGEVIWSENFKLENARIFEARDDISRQVSQHLTQQLGFHEQHVAYHGSFNDLETWQHVHLGKWYMSHPNSDNIAQARLCYERALELDPDQPEVLFALSWWHIWQAWTRIGAPGSHEHLVQAFDFAKRGQRLTPQDATSYAFLGAIEILRSNPGGALALLDEALQRNPSLAFAYANKGSALLQLGRAAEAADMLETATILNPYDRYRFHTLGEFASACYFAGDYERAKTAARKSLILSPKYWYPTIIQIAADHRLHPSDPHAMQHALWQQVSRDYPDIFDRIADIPFSDPAMNADFASILKKIASDDQILPKNRSAS